MAKFVVAYAPMSDNTMQMEVIEADNAPDAIRKCGIFTTENCGGDEGLEEWMSVLRPMTKEELLEELFNTDYVAGCLELPG